MSNIYENEDFDETKENFMLAYGQKMHRDVVLTIATKMTELEYEEHTRKLLMGAFPFERVFDKWIRILKRVESHP